MSNFGHNTPKTSFAAQLWLKEQEYLDKEDQLWAQVAVICGFNDVKEIEDFPFEEVTHDWYDQTIELKNVKVHWMPTSVQMRQILDLGFSACWINYIEPSKFDLAMDHLAYAKQRWYHTDGRWNAQYWNDNWQFPIPLDMSLSRPHWDTILL